MTQRAATLAELLSCTSDGKRTVAKSSTTGEHVHIENANKGLACDCVCPGCGRPMVAHKGVRRQHFQHAAEVEGRTCTSSGETALHKFAKKALASALTLRLPALSESDGRRSVEVVEEGVFEFESATLEKRDGEVIPDVVCLKGKRRLHVEFMVTHACGPEKMECIRKLDVGAIEIDLSGYRDFPLSEVASAILSDAPRKWLHNPKSLAAREKLADMERNRLAGIESEAQGLVDEAARSAPDLQDIGEWEGAAVEHGLGSAIAASGLAVGFLVREEEWKAFILLQFGLLAKQGFRIKEVFSAIKANGWVARRFCFVNDEVAAAMRLAAGRELKVPWEAVGDFLNAMTKAGMLIPLDLRGRLAGGRNLYSAIKAAAELRERPGKRKEQVRDIVAQILSPVRAAFKEGFDCEVWLDLPDDSGITPSQTVVADDGSFEVLVGKLERLRREMCMRPPQVTDSIGLPVLQEVRARTAALRLAEEKRTREAAEKAEREAAEREASLANATLAAMGAAASNWMSSPQDLLGGLSPAAMARRSQPDYAKAAAALDRWRLAVREEEERQARQDKALTTLRAAARAGFKRDDYAQLWMRQPHRDLEGKRPEEFCRDSATLATCVALLPGRAGQR